MAHEYDTSYSYSTLQVVPGTEPQIAPDRSLPQAIPASPEPEEYHTADKYTYVHEYDQTSATAIAAPTSAAAAATPTKKRQICGWGVSPKIFWALIYGAVILVLAGVGGGIGAAMSNHNSSERAAADSAGTATTGSAATSTRKATTPAQTAVTYGSRTLWRDCPAANMTVYTPSDTDQQFRKLCSNLFIGITGQAVNDPYESLNDCIDACAAFNQDNESAIKSGKKNPCSSVCWRNTWNTDYPGQCFGFTMVNTTDGQFNVSTKSKDHECDSAAWINIDVWNATVG
ncbi:hypothetical protein PFICI_12266 [Pestalotiopsis fici W106-1]|uniref:Apple domain-containing protein n=1 Tax=Pestalotiopsis fici (strain W106-1 / CGMCC3.15140) TaxID=1229662 RepID=W3WQB2_PESFW|nr:uncharacterized protein PFICI_12266 [Pestalotiopsis fici W106-1]ETS75322.1 hypothetical protein PFICI_12266 [Pestalotiopsis fici W106-1]